MKTIFAAALLLLVPFTTEPLFSQQPDTIDGIVWHVPILLSNPDRNGYLPRIALGGEETVHVTWTTERDSTFLPYVRSTDGGSSFEPVRDLLPDRVAYRYPSHHALVLANAANVYVIFSNSEPYDSPARLAKSSDFGLTFTPVRDLTSDDVLRLFAATNNGDTLLFYHVRSPFDRALLRSVDGGNQWARSNEDVDDESGYSLTFKGLHFLEPVEGYGVAEIEYRVSSDFGLSWNHSMMLSENDAQWSDLPSVASSEYGCGMEIWAAWRDQKLGFFGLGGASIICRRSLDGGLSWLPEEFLTQKPQGTCPSIALSSGVRAVCWWKDIAVDSAHVSVRASNNSFSTLLPEVDVTPHSYTGSPPAIAVSSNAVHVVYEELVGGYWGTFQIFYRKGEFLPRGDVGFSSSKGLIQFEKTQLGDSRSDTIRVHNPGTEVLRIGTAISSDTANFSVSPENVSIQGGESALFTVSFNPQSVGEKNARIIFYHGGPTSPDCISVSGEGEWKKQEITYESDTWQLVSSPLIPMTDVRLPSLFSYDTRYQQEEQIQFGTGYWARPSTDLVEYIGEPVTTDTFHVNRGWNLIGSISTPVPSNEIISEPPEILTSPFYSFDGAGYEESVTLNPGKAYWIKVKQDGIIVLDGSASHFAE